MRELSFNEVQLVSGGNVCENAALYAGAATATGAAAFGYAGAKVGYRLVVNGMARGALMGLAAGGLPGLIAGAAIGGAVTYVAFDVGSRIYNGGPLCNK